MAIRGEGKRTAAGQEKAGGRLRLLERYVHTERLEMSHEWVVKLGNKDGAQIDVRTLPSKAEAENVANFVRGIVSEILAQVAPEGMNHLVTLRQTAGVEVEWQRP